MSSKPKLLVVDDDEDLRTQMRWALADEFDVVLAGDRAAALDAVRAEHPAVVTLDLGLPPHAGGVEEGFAALDEIQALDPAAKVIVITGREERAHALHAVEQGGYDFFVKPIDVDELKVVLRRALRLHALEAENRELRQRAPAGGFEGMLGTSPRMQEVFAAVRKVATVDAPVLLTGESGTGKEVAARAIHRLSARAAGPFVPINCAAIPETLLESELFGHEKGAFTGAHAQRRGRIETAHGGTLFLDEIGELPTALQVKLLRFLQDHRVERLGGRGQIAVDARVITATNADLAAPDGRGPLPRGPLLPHRRRLDRAAAAARPRGRRDRDRRVAARTSSRPRRARRPRGSRRTRWRRCARTPGRATCASSRTACAARR